MFGYFFISVRMFHCSFTQCFFTVNKDTLGLSMRFCIWYKLKTYFWIIWMVFFVLFFCVCFVRLTTSFVLLSSHLTRVKMYWNLVIESPEFVSFDANMTHFGTYDTQNVYIILVVLITMYKWQFKYISKVIINDL